MQPLVSLCLPIRNGISNDIRGSKNLIKLLDSIFNQNYKNLQIIISENCSDDDTLNVLKNFFKKKKKYKLFIQKKKLNWADNFRFVLSKAEGKYIKWIASDDLISENFIKENVKFLENNKSYIFSASRFYFDKINKVFYKNNFENNHFDRIQKFFKIRAYSHNLIYGLIRKSKLKKTTNISKDYLAIDWIIELELLLQGKFKTIDSGYMIFGTKGMSKQKNFLKRKEYKSKLIYLLLPHYELTKILLQKICSSRSFSILEILKIFTLCVKLNIKHIVKYQILK
jgi:glycosyltransferase involved in cell wall biosynthesis